MFVESLERRHYMGDLDPGRIPVLLDSSVWSFWPPPILARSQYRFLRQGNHRVGSVTTNDVSRILQTPVPLHFPWTETRVSVAVVTPSHRWGCWSRVYVCRLTIRCRCSCPRKMWSVAVNYHRAVQGASPTLWLESMPRWAHHIWFNTIHRHNRCSWIWFV